MQAPNKYYRTQHFIEFCKETMPAILDLYDFNYSGDPNHYHELGKYIAEHFRDSYAEAFDEPYSDYNGE